jgi:predicted RNA-binding Zn-ribbon protein involved in translation (DUF1610 family)
MEISYFRGPLTRLFAKRSLMKNRCPGMDPAKWSFDDIAAVKCPACKADIEFWKDDVKLRCPMCGRDVFNPAIDNTCLSWCKSASECIGNTDIALWKKRKTPEAGRQG